MARIRVDFRFKKCLKLRGIPKPKFPSSFLLRVTTVRKNPGLSGVGGSFLVSISILGYTQGTHKDPHDWALCCRKKQVSVKLHHGFVRRNTQKLRKHVWWRPVLVKAHSSTHTSPHFTSPNLLIGGQIGLLHTLLERESLC